MSPDAKVLDIMVSLPIIAAPSYPVDNWHTAMLTVVSAPQDALENNYGIEMINHVLEFDGHRPQHSVRLADVCIMEGGYLSLMPHQLGD